MTPEQRRQLEEVVDEGGFGRIFRDLDELAQRIDAFAVHYAGKAKGVARGALPTKPVTLDGVLAECRSNPYRVHVLLQAMAFGCTPEMLTMIWMSELGCNIQKLTVDYERRARGAPQPGRAVLDVELRLLDGSKLAFRSTEVWDLAVMRFVGLAKSDDDPVMSGFSPLVLPARSTGHGT